MNPYQDQIDQLQAKIEENEALVGDPELGELAAQEITRLKTQKEMLEKAADDMASSQESSDPAGQRHTNAILEFRQGAGGDEAKIWAEELERMYVRFAENLGLKVEYVDQQVIKIKGKAELEGESFTAYEIFEFESGVHRVQRVPVTESQGRVHTSTATVAVLPEVHPQAVEVKDEDLTWEFMRAGGAGGQSVNKTSSAVRLTHVPSGLIVNARQERKQTQNRQIALELLRAQLWEIQEEERLKKIGKARASIGRARRAEKIRTYNFPQNRVTDHRINESWYDLENIVDGGLTKVIIETRQNLNEAED